MVDGKGRQKLEKRHRDNLPREKYHIVFCAGVLLYPSRVLSAEMRTTEDDGVEELIQKDVVEEEGGWKENVAKRNGERTWLGFVLCTIIRERENTPPPVTLSPRCR